MAVTKLTHNAHLHLCNVQLHGSGKEVCFCPSARTEKDVEPGGAGRPWC